jgi:hypothetical protein
MNNGRRDATRHFRNKKKPNLKSKIGETETSSKLKILGTCVGARLPA